ncbi:MAG: MFS transporter [Stackebrandtia sp.]
MTVAAEHRLNPSESRKAIVAGSVGNFIEWYDFAVYGYMAKVLGEVFFPSEDPVVSLLSSFGVFAVAFFFRPLGALLFGLMGDSAGRRPTLVVIQLSMAVSTTAIGFLPSYEAASLFAPVLLVLCRAVQGLSAGGEYGGAVSLMVEYAPRSKRGFYGSWQSFSVGLGLLGGVSIATFLTTVLSADAMQTWGWRVPFLVGALLGPIALFLRLRVEETPVFRQLKKERESRITGSAEIPAGHIGKIFHSIGAILGWTCAGYVFLIVMPSYLSEVLKMPDSRSLLATFVANAAFTAFIPVFGMLSDIFGRRNIMLIGAVGIFAGSYPLFLALSLPGLLPKLFALFVAGTLVAAFAGPGPAMMSELFATERRFSGLSLGYSLSTAAFGGTAPFIVTWLTNISGDPRAAAFYVMAGAAVSVLALSRLRRDGHLAPLR